MFVTVFGRAAVANNVADYNIVIQLKTVYVVGKYIRPDNVHNLRLRKLYALSNIVRVAPSFLSTHDFTVLSTRSRVFFSFLRFNWSPLRVLRITNDAIVILLSYLMCTACKPIQIICRRRRGRRINTLQVHCSRSSISSARKTAGI